MLWLDHRTSGWTVHESDLTGGTWSAASAVSLLHDVEPPDGWEEQARSRFLEGYFETVDSSLLPAGQAAIERLLAVFELEKAVYELQYELNNRPDWVAIPVRGIQRLIEESSTPA